MKLNDENPVLRRRLALAMLSATVMLPTSGFAALLREISWDDLIPPGVPYSEIIGEGALDQINDIWNPIYDANATKLNEVL